VDSITDTSNNATLKRSFTYENGKEKENQITQEDQDQGAKKSTNLEKKTETAEEALANAKIKFQELEIDYTNSTNDVAIANDELEDLKEQKKEAKQEDKSKFKTDIDKAKDKLKSAKQKQREAKKLKAEAKLSVTKLSAVAKKESDNIKKLEAKQKQEARELEVKKRLEAQALEAKQKQEARELAIKQKQEAKANAISEYSIEYNRFHSEGKPLATIENTEILLYYFNIKIRYNEVLHNIEVVNPESELGDNDTDELVSELKDVCIANGLSKQCIIDYISVIAKKNKYNPVADWIRSKAWDGKSRIDEFLNTVTAEDESLKTLLMTKWLIAAVAAIFVSEDKTKENFWCKSVLVFQGKQSLEKTKWFKKIVPLSMVDYIATGLSLDTNNKDDVISVTRSWIGEFGELDHTLKTHPSKLKAFLTKDKDSYRPPYGRTTIDVKRRTVFFASVNPREFLLDETGNTRYWCLGIKDLDVNHKTDMQQLFAEVYETLYLKGVVWYLNSKEETRLEESNRQFEVIRPLQEQLAEKFDLCVARTEKYTPTKVLEILGYDKPTKVQAKEMGAILAKIFKSSRRSYGTVYEMPEPKIKFQ
jgi:putative DNA primase/helicase